MSRIVRKLIALVAVIVMLAVVSEMVMTAWSDHPMSNNIKSEDLSLQRELLITQGTPGGLTGQTRLSVLLDEGTELARDRDWFYNQMEEELAGDDEMQYPDDLRDDEVDDQAAAPGDGTDDVYPLSDEADIKISVETPEEVEEQYQGYMFDNNLAAARAQGGIRSEAAGEGLYDGSEEQIRLGDLVRESQTTTVETPPKEEEKHPFVSQIKKSVQELEDAQRADAAFYEAAVTKAAMVRSGSSTEPSHSSDAQASKDGLALTAKRKEPARRVKELQDGQPRKEKKYSKARWRNVGKRVPPHSLEVLNSALKRDRDQLGVPPLLHSTDASLRDHQRPSSLQNFSKVSHPVVRAFTEHEVATIAGKASPKISLPATITSAAATSLWKQEEPALHSPAQGMGNARPRRKEPPRLHPPKTVKLSKNAMQLLALPIPTNLPLVEERGFPQWRNSSALAGNLVYLREAVRITQTKKRPLTNLSLNPDIVARGEFQQTQMDKFCQQQHFLSQLPTDPADLNTLLQHLLYDDSKKIVFCYIPKNGCSNMKRLLLILNGILPQESVSHRPAEELLKTVHSFRTLTPEQALYRLQNYYKLVIVRNPLERLLSAYRNKIEPQLDFERRHTFPEKVKMFILQCFRQGAVREWMEGNHSTPISPTFAEFLRFMNMYPLNQYNEHFMPSLRLCSPCAVHYDFYANFKSLDYDIFAVLDYLSISTSFYPKSISHIQTPTRTLLHRYFEKLTWQQKKSIFGVFSQELQFYYSLHPEEENMHRAL